MDKVKYKISKRLLFFLSSELYLNDIMELVFFTAIGTLTGRISMDKDNHFSKIHDFSKEQENELLMEDPNLLSSDENSFIIIKDAKVYPTTVIHSKEYYESYPEIALFLDQIIAVTMIPKLS